MVRGIFVILLIAIAMQTDSAFADTVDAQAKPYLILGGVVAGIGFSGLGFFSFGAE